MNGIQTFSLLYSAELEKVFGRMKKVEHKTTIRRTNELNYLILKAPIVFDKLCDLTLQILEFLHWT